MGGCIIHYGMPKTGSSSIQTWMLRKMQDPRFVYLNLGKRGSGNLMVSAFLDEPERHHRSLKRGVSAAQLRGELDAIRTSLRGQLQQLDARTAVFSAELLANVSAAEFGRLCEFLAPYCDPIRAVGYVRSPVSFMESVFQQRLKSGVANLNLRQLYPRYRERFGKFEEQLGAANVEYWAFEPRSFAEGCVVRDFCARLGIERGDEKIPRVNDSLSLPAIRLLYAYRKFGPGYGKGEEAMRENRDLKECLLGLQGPRMRLHADLVLPFLETQRADIDWMSERLGHSLHDEGGAEQGGIRSEEELLRCDPESLAWLGQQLGLAPGPRVADPQQVADWMHELRLKIAARASGSGGGVEAPGKTPWWRRPLRSLRRGA